MDSSQDAQQPHEGHLNPTADVAIKDQNQITPQTDKEEVEQTSLKHLVTATSEQ